MISNALFKISLNESIFLLQKLKLYKDKGPKDIGKYSKEFKNACRSNKHIEIYNSIRDNLDYEIVLKDDSFFQFSIDDNYLRMSYIENPNYRYSKREFLEILYPPNEVNELSDDDLDNLIDENEYEQFLNEQEINSNLVYIRYDYDEKGYKPLLHSYSHIHIGLKENFRIPTSLILTPMQFVCFCIKQVYHDIWSIYHNDNVENNVIVNKLASIKKQCIKISIHNWHPIEENELYIK